MAKRPRIWTKLKESTRLRYLASGKRQGLTPQQVQAHYESGGKMSVFRGHPTHHGVSERQWTQLRQAAKRSKLHEDVEDVNEPLEAMLAKGYSVVHILRILEEKEESRDTYRSAIAKSLRSKGIDAGWQPGRARYFKRDLRATIELFYYH